MEQRLRKPEVRGDANLRYELVSMPTLTYKGETYRQKTNVTSILLIGVDKLSDAEMKNTYRNGGQADFLRLLAIDSTARTVYQIAIDRDTMTPITILGVLGNRTGTRTERISLSHGFGDGKEQSCELTVEAASNLLYQVPIDYYAALNMDGISELNDLLGGVTVTLEDDFSSIDPIMTKGTTLTLHGEQAEIFVRSRMSVGIGTNEARMKRQEEYLSSAQTLLMQILQKDTNAAGTLYDGLTPYLTTNLSRGRMVNEAYAVKDYVWEDVIRPDGTHSVDDDGFMQFVVDETSLQEAVLAVFYEKVSESPNGLD